jgi:hypothetical protein
MLRCESLNALDALTCSRVLVKNYALLVSMAPLNRDVRSVVRYCALYFDLILLISVGVYQSHFMVTALF